MGLFQRKSALQRAADVVVGSASSVAWIAKPVGAALGSAVGLIAASATVSSLRSRRQRQQQK